MRTFIFILPLFTLISCGDQLDKASRDIRKELELTRQALDKAVNTAAVAVPGERYLRLIEDSRSADPKKKAEAQDLVRRLFGVDLDTEYEVTAWFGFNEQNKLRADIFQTTTNTALEVRAAIDNDLVNLDGVKNTLSRPLTEAEIRAKVQQHMTEAIDTLVGNPQPPSRSRGASSESEIPMYRWPSGLLDHQVPFNPYLGRSRKGKPTETEKELAAIKSGKEAIIAALMQGLTAHYETISTPLQGGVLSKKWVPGKGPFVYVVIDEEDWAKHGGNIEVSVALHKKGDAGSRLGNERVYRFRRSEFTTRGDPVEASKLSTRLRWAVHNMTGDRIELSELGKLTELEAILSRLDEAREIDEASGAP